MRYDILEFSSTDVTGNNNSPAGQSEGFGKQTVITKFTAGATPTVAIAIQGSFDGASWQTLVVIEEGVAAETKAISTTKTATGIFYFIISKGWWRYVRVALSANTNMTLNKAWLTETT